MDCEGAEFSLLDPANDPILIRANILVEIHPEFGNKHEIIRRFEGTHNITEIIPSVRAVSDIRVGPIKNVDLLGAADERRGDQSWLFLEMNASRLFVDGR